MNTKRLTPIFLIVIAFLSGVLAADFLRQYPTDGNIKAIGFRLYDDLACTLETVSIPWGVMEPSATYYTTRYVKNTQSVDITLSTNTTDWLPVEAEAFLTIGWNYTGTILLPNAILPVEFTITVDPAVEGIGDWSAIINILATEAGSP